jgi:hypothetical protein
VIGATAERLRDDGLNASLNIKAQDLRSIVALFELREHPQMQ